MSLTRLAKVGLFQKLPQSDDPVFKFCHNEIILHRAVLDRALVDSFSQSKGIRQNVYEWLDIENPEFLDACERALLDPKLVLVTFKIMKKVLVGEKARYREFGKHSKPRTEQ